MLEGQESLQRSGLIKVGLRDLSSKHPAHACAHRDVPLSA